MKMSARFIKYKVNLEVDIEEYLDQLRINKGYYKTEENSSFRSVFDVFLKAGAKKVLACQELINSRQYFSYSLKPNEKEMIFIREVNRKGKDEVIKLDLEKREKKVYFTDEEGNRNLVEESFNLKASEEVKYVVEKKDADIKEIMGYKCYKLSLLQEVTKDGDTRGNRYEMYVTDELPFPAHILLELATPIVTGCPLEVSMVDTWNDKQKTVLTVVEVKEIIDRDIVKEINQKWEIEEPFLEKKQVERGRANIRSLACS